MVDNKTKLDIGYGYMHIHVIFGFISGYKEIIGQHWYKLNFLRVLMVKQCPCASRSFWSIIG
jgi:hypothetical protein